MNWCVQLFRESILHNPPSLPLNFNGRLYFNYTVFRWSSSILFVYLCYFFVFRHIKVMKQCWISAVFRVNGFLNVVLSQLGSFLLQEHSIWFTWCLTSTSFWWWRRNMTRLQIKHYRRRCRSTWNVQVCTLMISFQWTA